MKEIMELGTEIKISSREIAELTGKEHKHIMRDLRNQFKTQEIDRSNFGHIFKDSYGREQKEYLLDYEQMMILLTGYSTKLRAKVVKRWVALENDRSAREIARAIGIDRRRDLTDAIKDSGENERMHGHAYSTYTNLVYKVLGLKKGNRDKYPKEILEHIKKAEEMAKAMVEAGLNYNEVKDIIGKSLIKVKENVHSIIEDHIEE